MCGKTRPLGRDVSGEKVWVRLFGCFLPTMDSTWGSYMEEVAPFHRSNINIMFYAFLVAIVTAGGRAVWRPSICLTGLTAICHVNTFFSSFFWHLLKINDTDGMNGGFLAEVLCWNVKRYMIILKCGVTPRAHALIFNIFGPMNQSGFWRELTKITKKNLEASTEKAVRSCQAFPRLGRVCSDSCLMMINGKR